MPKPEPPESWADLRFFIGGDASAWADLWGWLEAEQQAGRNWQPSADRIFRALQLTPRDQVRVVILGQDPYPEEARATGLAFSFPEGQPPRDSLCNIYAELFDDLGVRRVDGGLADWAEQGVLLLNIALTVQINEIGSHLNTAWRDLASQVLRATCVDGNCCYLLWGRRAISMGRAAEIPPERTYCSSHPSPQSAHRALADHPAFAGSLPFRWANKWLRERGMQQIAWGNQ